MNLEQFKKENKYLLFAFDHRGSFKKFVKPDNPDSATDEEIINLKKVVIESLDDLFSGILIDEDWGLPAYEKKDKPYLLCMEKSGYTDIGGDRLTELKYSGDVLEKYGASGAKLLVYVNPFAEEALEKQIVLAKKALEDAHEHNLPFFLEIVTYGNEEAGKSRSEWVLKSLQKFVEKGVLPDVWKMEYPENLESCKKITEIAGNTPWILLTRGVEFDVFAKQLKDAVAAGASGFLAGRALWQEIKDYKDEKTKKEFLEKVVRKRFQKISDIVLSTK